MRPFVTVHRPWYLAGWGLLLLWLAASGCATVQPRAEAEPDPAPVVPSVAVLAAQVDPPEPEVDVAALPRADLPADTLLLAEEKRDAFFEALRTTLIGHGRASFYGRRFAGRRTASGERFDPSALTAAHRTLPFGARVRVTNLENDRSVVVRINDRGPYAHQRVIDLSRSAARRLGFIEAGTAPVKLELIAPEP